ncbi:p-hydroxybenzoic acid efflux pump subunit AaeB [BD1-7 clade bacterium]|uniref:p-hydroxybenzoic acid efflux pump subunit AaeB n=1 Tax=BD1-7 clade bacterium TaxID=2029982 RepID=A0A5S9PLJ9_9GAMM|nr:p-hydroxybenzoic acid efflux pump subunit AaeB [BD1-7 clade bacterium]CAA0105238.1 p-hydroxybenzoic acid efflux pump subunit AaeB [BD1-7 clade bacterium]
MPALSEYVMQSREFTAITIVTRCLIASLMLLSIAFATGLPEPSWGILTISLLGLRADYGGLWAKSMALLAGNILGGLVGLVTVLTLNDAPWLLITVSSCFFALCAGYTASYQGMAGYGSYLAMLTASLVITANIAQSDVTAISYFAVYRISEISLGIICIALSSVLIFPTLSYHDLQFHLRQLQNTKQTLLDMAFAQTPVNDKHFARQYEITCIKALDVLQHRYYLSRLDARIRRISGAFDNAVFESLSVAAVALIIRHMRLNPKATFTQSATGNTINDPLLHVARQKFEANQNALEELASGLDSPTAMKALPNNQQRQDALLRKSLPVALRRAMAMGAASMMAFTFWVLTGFNQGNLVIFSAAVCLFVQILLQKDALEAIELAKGVLFCAAIVFVIEFIVMIHVNTFAVFFLAFALGAGLLLWISARNNTNLAALLGVIFYAIYMPADNTMPFDAEQFLNTVIAVSIGAFIAFSASKMAGRLHTRTIMRHNLYRIRHRLIQILTSHRSVNEHSFRRLILVSYLDVRSKQGYQHSDILMLWFNTWMTIGINLMHLQHLQLSGEQKRLFDATREHANYLITHIALPGEANMPLEESRFYQLRTLVEASYEQLCESQNTVSLRQLLLAYDLIQQYKIMHRDHPDIMKL